MGGRGTRAGEGGPARPPDSVVTPERLASLFNPTGVVIVGASDTSPWSRNFYDNLRGLGFSGAVVPVHPRHRSTFGIPNRRSLLEVDEAVDLGVLLVPTSAVEEVLEEAGEIGLRNVVVVAAGFGEQGGAGRDREARLRQLALSHGMTLLGPNCPGYVNPVSGASPYGFALGAPPLAGPVAAVLQSGALASSVLAYGQTHGVGTSLLVSMGNESVVGTVDVMDYLVTDDATRVIALFLEGIRDGGRFLAVAERARSAGKPVVAMKVGRSPSGRRATLAHTGAVAGDDVVVDAAFRDVGVTRVRSLEELVVTAGLLASPSRPRGRRMAVVTFSGGACDIIADRVGEEAIELPDFAPSTSAALGELLPSFARPTNPLDVTGFQLAETRSRMPMADALDIVVRDPGIDFVVYMGVPLPERRPEGPLLRQVEERAADLGRVVADAPMPVVLASQTDAQVGEYARDLLTRNRLYVLAGLDLGMKAIGHALRWELGPADGGAGDGTATETVAGLSGTPWSEDQARRLLSDAGVPVVPGELVGSSEAAVQAAERLGYPVVLKVNSASVTHKSDVGGVLLDLRSAEEVRRAYARLAEVAASVAPGSTGGVLVTAMRAGGVELVVGVRRDPVFGPVLAVGSGGVLVEVLQDVRVRLLPLDAGAILGMLDELRAAPLLHGVRGTAAVDRSAVAEVVAGVAAVALELGDALETLEV
ncbi:MAG: acetate--CoA ligase family protein, partial [Acidimicrobiales bacterium]